MKIYQFALVNKLGGVEEVEGVMIPNMFRLGNLYFNSKQIIQFQNMVVIIIPSLPFDCNVGTQFVLATNGVGIEKVEDCMTLIMF